MSYETVACSPHNVCIKIVHAWDAIVFATKVFFFFFFFLNTRNNTHSAAQLSGHKVSSYFSVLFK